VEIEDAKRIAAGIALSFLILHLSPAEACRCNTEGAAFVHLARNATLVVQGTVETQAERGAIQVRISRVLKGSLDRPGEPIKIWGDDGHLCRPYVSTFPRGTEWVFVLANRSFGGFPQRPGPRDYWISICGAHWVRVEGNRVSGRIRDAATEEAMSVDHLLKLLGKS